MGEQYKRGENPRSLANLGKPKTKAGRFNFTLTEASGQWLSRQPNKSAAIDQLIQNQNRKEIMASLPIGIPSTMPYEILGESNFPHDLERAEQQNGATHYKFKSVLHRDGRYYLKARPWANWKERQEAEMTMMGI